jgi:Fe2+ transport system protein FeoA
VQALTWFWLSFVKDGKNVGCCMVQGADEAGARGRVNELGINPGGEICIYPLAGFSPHAQYRDRLLTPEEARPVADGDLEAVGTMLDASVFDGPLPVASIVRETPDTNQC